MAVISAGVDESKFTDDVGRSQMKIKLFRRLLRQNVDEAVEDVAEEFRDEVKEQIKSSDIEEDTGELLNSWRVYSKGIAHYRVRSTAEHALYLELGTEPHTITGSPWLKFQPADEKQSEYPRRTGFIDAPEDEQPDGADLYQNGLVVEQHDPLADAGPGTYFARSVNHPGNRAYGYFEDAINSRSWTTSLNNKVDNAFRDAKDEAGL